MFSINEIVLCCEDYILPHTREELSKNMPNWVKKGEKYKIRCFNDNNGIFLGVLLEEIVNTVLYFKLIGKSQECAFRLDRFRKFEDDKVEEQVEELEIAK